MRNLGWAGWIRTNECRDQNPVPYRLATAQWLVEEAGFEPAKALPADLQSAPFGQLGNSSTCSSEQSETLLYYFLKNGDPDRI